MAKVSICMIVKNEEKILEKSLQSISWFADEIIIVDTGSTDRTVEIAKKFTNKVYFFKWVSDFSKAREFVQGFAKYDFILKWDADEVLRKGKGELVKLKEKILDNYDLVYITWNVDFGINNYPIRQTKQLSIYRKQLFRWESPIHNKIVLKNPDYKVRSIFLPKIEIDHLKDREVKSHRYSQTQEILENTLSQKDDFRLLFLDVQNLIFLKKWRQAKDILENKLDLFSFDSELYQRSIFFTASVIEIALQIYTQLSELDSLERLFKLHKKLIKKDPGILLSYADYLSLKSPEIALKVYLDYLKNPASNNLEERPFNYERYVTHPYEMIGSCYALVGNSSEAKKYWKIALKLSKSGITKKAIFTNLSYTSHM